MKKLAIGVDIGGINTAFGLVDENGDLYAESVISTKKYPYVDDYPAYVEDLCDSMKALSQSVSFDYELMGIGIGAPNANYHKGTIETPANLWRFKETDADRTPERRIFHLAEDIARRFDGTKVLVTNDANAAALGEARYGAGKEYKNSILVTLGTGVGGGIIIDGKLFEGGHSVGTEIGHMVIERHGEMCTCGRRGCFERYSSATALTARTRYAMEEDAGSAMWSKYTSQTCTGKTAFEFKDVDRSAKEVVDWYVKYLACGLVNLANIFRPEVIMLGGGVSAQGECLTKPVQEIVNKELFGGCDYAPVTVITASLGNRAGAMGAAAFAMDEIKMGE